MKHYNLGTERNRMIDYRAFVNGLRHPLEEGRLRIVEEAF